MPVTGLEWMSAIVLIPCPTFMSYTSSDLLEPATKTMSSCTLKEIIISHEEEIGNSKNNTSLSSRSDLSSQFL